MPIATKGEYPPNWPEITNGVKCRAGWCCVRCGHPHEPESGYMLTVHHLDGDRSNNRWWNLPALCQRCHLRFQGKVVMDQVWVMVPHSDWFQPYVAGFYAYKYKGWNLTRREVEANLEGLLQLEMLYAGVKPHEDGEDSWPVR